jgi:hypothetical protein
MRRRTGLCVTVVADSGNSPLPPPPVGAAATQGDGSILVNELGQVSKVEANGEKSVVAKDLKGPESIAVAPDGKLIVAEVGAKRIVSIDPAEPSPKSPATSRSDCRLPLEDCRATSRPTSALGLLG